MAALFVHIYALLLNCANATNGSAALRALPFNNRLAVFGKTLFRITHFSLLLALYAISFDGHVLPRFFRRLALLISKSSHVYRYK